MNLFHHGPTRVSALYFVFLFLVPAACAVDRSAARDTAKPPVTRKENVVDVLHGIEISDPYQWLEDQDAPETREWIAAQNAYTDAILGQVPGRDRFRELARKLLQIESTGIPVEAGGRYFFTRRLPGQDLDVLHVRDGLEGNDRVLIDPHPMSEDHTVNIAMLDVSSDGRLLVYAKRQGGADESEIRVLDVDRGSDLDDALPTGLYIGMAMRPDGKGFYYGLFGGEGPRLKYHALGTDPAGDPVVYGEDALDQELLLPAISDDGRWLLLNILEGTSGPTRIHLKHLEEDGPFETVIRDGKSHSMAAFAGDHLLITTDLDAPNRRVMKADLRRPGVDHWKELIPERDGVVIEQAAGVGGKVFLSYLQNVRSKIAVFDLEGKKHGEIDFPVLGSLLLGSGRWNSREAFLVHTSFHVPSTIYRMDLEDGAREVWSKIDIPIDMDQVEVEQVFYTSKDGTRVPMFIVHRKGLVLDGSHPALLTGYGGFNLSLTPFFDPVAAAWVDLGGVFASANLRGGGEFGEAWHEAGMLANKQNVFDDFAAAAEFLSAKGYTRPERLAVMGGSNGGLLTGALLTQRPDLVAAVICTYPLLDMIRYHHFLLGRYWVAEYGCSDDPEQFEFLLAYSPYHRVKEGEHYPATLFITGDLDTRVDPLHARKMAARVQACNASPDPILLRYHIRAGHAAAPPVSQQIEELVDLFSFLSRQVGLEMN
jgi:prolyl oligopeptidase